MKTKNISIALLLLASLLLSSCATISPTKQGELTTEARTALNALYASTPEARELQPRAKAILVFPDILKAGLIAGGSGGNGVLFSSSGKVLGYYNSASVSWGLQAGAQTFSQALFLMTSDSLEYLDRSDGWSIGTGPSVVLIDTGAAKDLSSTTLRSDVYAFIYGQQGLMGGIGIQGQKITKLKPKQ